MPRIAAAALAGALIVAAGWGALGYLTAGVTARQERMRRTIGVLEPELQRQDDERRRAAVGTCSRPNGTDGQQIPEAAPPRRLSLLPGAKASPLAVQLVQSAEQHSRPAFRSQLKLCLTPWRTTLWATDVCPVNSTTLNGTAGALLLLGPPSWCRSGCRG